MKTKKRRMPRTAGIRKAKKMSKIAGMPAVMKKRKNQRRQLKLPPLPQRLLLKNNPRLHQRLKLSLQLKNPNQKRNLMRTLAKKIAPITLILMKIRQTKN
jgi:hypothetical protein